MEFKVVWKHEESLRNVIE